jgi:TonB family protein
VHDGPAEAASRPLARLASIRVRHEEVVMRLRAAAWWWVAGLGWASIAGGQEAPPAADSGPPSRIQGVWVSNANPNGAIQIVSCGGTTLSISCFKRLDAAGFFENDAFVGLCRELESDASKQPYRLSVLRLRLTGADEARAEFSSSLQGKPVRTEVWRRTGRFGVPADAAAGAVPDSMPQPGDRVEMDEPPEALERVPPDYPTWARNRNVSGTVMVQALVGRDGRVKRTLVVKSIPELDDYAVAAVKQWTFKPARAKGEPVAVWVTVPVAFTLH